MALARIPFDSGRMLCQMPFGAWILVDMQNVDVAPGIWRDGVIEPWTTTIFKSRLTEGDIVVDIGANHGYYSMLGASIVRNSGKIYAFEANPRTFSNLMRTVYFSGYPDIVELYWRAVSESSGDIVRIAYDISFSGGGSIRSSSEQMFGMRNDQSLVWSPETLPGLVDADGRWIKGRGIFTEAHVTTIRLDDIPDLRARPIRLFKLDIEGHEAKAILGARELIAANRSASIVMEWFGQYLDQTDPRRAGFLEMIDFLFKSERFKAYEIRPIVSDNPSDILRAVSVEDFMRLPHCDVLLER